VSNVPPTPPASLLGRLQKALCGWLKKMWSFYVAHLPQVLAALVIVFVVVLLVRLLGNSSGSSSSIAVTRPAEFAYLDPTRIASYLSQIEGRKSAARA
jgi:hypothetical protein